MGILTLEDPERDYWAVELQSGSGWGVLVEDGRVAVFLDKNAASKEASKFSGWPATHIRKIKLRDSKTFFSQKIANAFGRSQGD